MKELTKVQKGSIVKQCDWMFWASLLMFIGIRISVLILFNMVAAETGADIQAVQTAYEANPVYKALLNLSHINYIIQFLILPATLCAVYFIYRRKVVMNNYSVDILQYFITFHFFFMLFNFLNDLFSLVGKVL